MRVRACSLWTVGAGVVMPTALIGLLHLPVAQPVLTWLMGECPLGEPLSAEEAERVRAESLVSIAGTTRAATTDALGFHLVRTDRAMAQSWADEHGIACVPSHDGLACSNVPAGRAVDVALDSLTLRFDPVGRLVSVDASRMLRDSDDALQIYDRLTASLTEDAGPASRRTRRRG